MQRAEKHKLECTNLRADQDGIRNEDTSEFCVPEQSGQICPHKNQGNEFDRVRTSRVYVITMMVPSHL
ncbi:hypothetical protein WAI453_008495 [Rhynchosporium graminicola]